MAHLSVLPFQLCHPLLAHQQQLIRQVYQGAPLLLAQLLEQDFSQLKQLPHQLFRGRTLANIQKPQCR